MLMQVLTKPRTTKYGHSHLLASCCRESLLRSSPASRPIKPTVDTTKVVKCLRCLRQDCNYFFFFLCSCVARTLWGSWDRYDLASVSVTRMSTIMSVPRAQKPRMRRSPRSSSLERDKRWTGDLGSLALVSSAVRLEWIIGSTRTAEVHNIITSYQMNLYLAIHKHNAYQAQRPFIARITPLQRLI
jgi:hypothetical protein